MDAVTLLSRNSQATLFVGAYLPDYLAVQDAANDFVLSIINKEQRR